MKQQHGGKRPGAGRKPEVKTSKKVMFLGIRMYAEERGIILRAIKAEEEKILT